jgi:hypothetical protein
VEDDHQPDLMERCLRQAMGRNEPRRIVRWIESADAVGGFVAGIGREWLVLLLAGPGQGLDGYCCVRRADLERVQPDTGGSFTTKLLERRGLLPLPALEHELDLDSTEGLLRSLISTGELLSLYIEERDPDECFVGMPSGLTATTVDLHEVNSRAEWDGTVSRWRLSEITRVEWSGSYERALVEVAGPAPALGEVAPAVDGDAVGHRRGA